MTLALLRSLRMFRVCAGVVSRQSHFTSLSSSQSAVFAVNNQEFFRDNEVNFIEFSNDRIPMLIKNQLMVLIWIKRLQV